MTPGPDGRAYACSFACGAETLVAIDGDQIAAGLRLDMANADAFLTELAGTLTRAVAERTRVQHHGSQVVHLEVTFEKDAFVAKRESHGVVAQHRKMVRGIALKTVTHPLPRWVELLTNALAAHANASVQVADAIARLRASGRSNG